MLAAGKENLSHFCLVRSISKVTGANASGEVGIGKMIESMTLQALADQERRMHS